MGIGGGYLALASVEEVGKIINYAFDRGVNYIDTAPTYGDSELRIGEVLPDRRDECILATKVDESTRDGAMRQLEESFKRMKTDFLDVWQLHGVESEVQLDELMKKGGAFDGLKEAKESGAVRFIGITAHFPIVLVKAIKTGEFDVFLLC